MGKAKLSEGRLIEYCLLKILRELNKNTYIIYYFCPYLIVHFRNEIETERVLFT